MVSFLLRNPRRIEALAELAECGCTFAYAHENASLAWSIANSSSSSARLEPGWYLAPSKPSVVMLVRLEALNFRIELGE